MWGGVTLNFFFGKKVNRGEKQRISKRTPRDS
jgi:hypothetical protein